MLPNENEQLWREVLVKLARIEEQTKGLDEITKDVSRALAISKENQKNITKLEANNKWAWGFIISIGISIVASFLTKGVF